MSCLAKLLAGVCALLATASAHGATGFVINPTWDASVLSLSSAAKSNFENGVNAAITEFEAYFSSPITINITFVASPGTSIFGESGFSLQTGYTYGEISNALKAHATTAADQTSIKTLTTTDPTGGGMFVVNDAQAKALGFLAARGTASDGTVTLGTGFNFTYDPNNRAVANKYDFIGVVEHEMSEIMGRVDGLDPANGYQAYDLFRYAASGSRSLDPNASGAYFSIDGGKTKLKLFNSDPGADIADWADQSPYSADAANAYSDIGVKNSFGSIDITAMDVMGYMAAPEPTTFSLCALPALAFLARRHRRARAPRV